MILGSDWLTDRRAILDFDNKRVTIESEIVPSRWTLFGRAASEGVLPCPRQTRFLQQIGERVDEREDNRSEDVLGDETGCLVRLFSEGGEEYDSEANDDMSGDVRINDGRDETIRRVNVDEREDMGVCCEEMSDDCTKEYVSEFDVLREGDCESYERMKQNERSENDSGLYRGQEERQFSEDVRRVAGNLRGISEAQRADFVRVLLKYRVLFTHKCRPAGKYRHRIQLIDPTKVFRKTYSVPFALRSAVEIEIRKMLDEGIIERSVSAFCNPLRIVKKVDGSVRICLDARQLNANMHADQEAPPLVEDIMQQYSGTQFLTTSDLAAGYWQIELADESRPYTAFLFDGKLYQFRRIPFGIKTAGSGFMRALSMALGDEFDSFLTRFVDDLLIASRSFDEHIHQIDKVFQRLQEQGFTLRFDKSKFCQSTVRFLGFELSTEGISPCSDRLDVIRRFDAPRSRRQLQQFLGICTYYRRFCARYSTYMDPFRGLLKAKGNWEWTESHDRAFERLKQQFANCIALSHVHPDWPYKLQTDASDRGIAGILYQTDPDGNPRVISMVSRCLSTCEQNYTTTEKELLGVVYSVHRLRTFLIGVKFTIVTDHKALVFLQTASFQSSRLIRWSMLLQSYNFEIGFCSGKDNVVADFFSRNPEGKFEGEEDKDYIVSFLGRTVSERIKPLISECPEFRPHIEILPDLQNADERIRKIKESLAKGDVQQSFCLHAGVVFHEDYATGFWRVVVPTSLYRLIIETNHNKLAHPGAYKTFQYLKRFYYWHGMYKNVKRFVKACDLCQRIKPLNVLMQGPYGSVVSRNPSELVTVDFYGPLPRSVGRVKYLFVMLDVYTKYVKLYPLVRATTETALDKVIHFYCRDVGFPTRILSDHGTQFTSPKWSHKLNEAGIKTVFSSIRHPQGNPTERVMREIGRCLRALCSKSHTSWARKVPIIEQLLNVTVHSSTGFTPLELHFGEQSPDEIYQLIDFPKVRRHVPRDKKLIIARERVEERCSERRKRQKGRSTVELRVGDFVMIRVPQISKACEGISNKLCHLYQGPYVITRDLKNNAYEVSEDTRVIGKYNRMQLRKYYTLERND